MVNVTTVWTEALSNTVSVNVASVVIGVYWDTRCTSPVTSIDWGTLYPGETKSKLIYVRNEGVGRVTLTLETRNWQPPEAEKYISVSWDYNGRSINPGEVISINLFLSVSPNISGITDFSFDIIISGYYIGALRLSRKSLRSKGLIVPTKIAIF